MTNFKHHAFTILPLLTILSVAPAHLSSHLGTRAPASVSELKEALAAHPKLKAKMDQKIGPNEMHLDKSKPITKEDFENRNLRLIADLNDLKEPSEDLEEDEKIMRLEKASEESELLEHHLGELIKAKSLSKEEEEAFKGHVADHKDKVESLLEAKEKQELTQKKDEFRRNEIRELNRMVEDEKNTERDDKKSSDKVAEKEEKKEEHTCSTPEQNPLTKQLEQLIASQNNIMMAMMNMTQTMMLLLQKQQQQPNPWYSNSVTPAAYQYQAPTAAGNWVYLPSGGSLSAAPSQQQGIYPNQFSAPQVPQPQMQQQQGSPQGYNGWQMKPDMGFELVRQDQYAPIMNPGFQMGPSVASTSSMAIP